MRLIELIFAIRSRFYNMIKPISERRLYKGAFRNRKSVAKQYSYKNMLYLLVVGCLFVGAECRVAKLEANLALTVMEDAPRFSEEIIRICAHETELSMKELLMFHANDFSNVTEVTQCFTHCLYEQIGLMHDGIFVEPQIVGHIWKFMNPAAWAQRACHSLRGENKCETAHKIHQCKQQIKAEQWTSQPQKANEPSTVDASTPTSRNEI